MRRDKRAQMSTFTRAVLTAGVLLILVTMVVVIARSQNRAIADLRCTQSIQAHIFDLKMKMEPKPIVCPTEFVRVETRNKQDIMELLADQQATCWHQWLKGEENMFPQDEGIFCHICNVNEFRYEDVKITKYIDYLKNHKLSDVAPNIAQIEGEDPILIDYLVPHGTAEFEKIVGQNPDLLMEDLQKVSIDTSEKQAVIFFYVKGEDKIHDFAEHVWPVSGATMAGALTVTLISVKVIGLAATGPVGWIVAGVAAVGFTTASIILKQEGHEARFSGITIKPYTERTLLDLGCEIIPASQEENT